jgi:hypothetical protein
MNGEMSKHVNPVGEVRRAHIVLDNPKRQNQISKTLKGSKT